MGDLSLVTLATGQVWTTEGQSIGSLDSLNVYLADEVSQGIWQPLGLRGSELVIIWLIESSQKAVGNGWCMEVEWVREGEL
ncbi:hypothetical protein EGR_03677 [Echinococcus granulosus]|uniref:Uncharacterized protein n=1 Tax=Echinococcus granulosus TaxID=6210 RepID=W6USN6_ECHGR|nr:hypothetical protein EGR_03677 [Echinococcus granulosus]EUB61387.1 hypothetical protein EGR_03677 [Echinococcus granulosus]